MKQNVQEIKYYDSYHVTNHQFFPVFIRVHCHHDKDTDQNQIKLASQPHDNNGLTNNERVVTSLVAGAIAGAIAKTTIAPLDRTKIFFQTSPSTHFSGREVLKYVLNTYKSTGFLSLWRGNSATMARIVPYAAIQFTAHEQWKRVLRVDQRKESEILRFVAGSLAGVTAQSLTYPLDLTRARLAISPKSKYKSLMDVFVKTTKSEGVKGLFKGYVPTIIGVIPYAGCSFYCYESLKRVWVKEFGPESVGGIERLCFGACAGIIGQTSSYPLDIVRRRLQTQTVDMATILKSRFHVFAIMKMIARTEGIVGGLYKGLSMNWVKGPVAAGISFASYDWIQGFLRSQLRSR
ncbi:unnamed protein product [Orchesella dallaii]|uniref:Solute carrier family 25 member 42 n=1 Tax=Orchesella dallaii TaxID=48710 RepID=A0ABP1RA06_9HEXA